MKKKNIPESNKEGYQENFFETEDEIFSLQTEILLCNRFIEEKSK